MDSNPNCHAYGETAYWDRRYNEERRKHGINHTFDWYLPCEELWPIIQTYCGVNKAFKVTPTRTPTRHQRDVTAQRRRRRHRRIAMSTNPAPPTRNTRSPPRRAPPRPHVPPHRE